MTPEEKFEGFDLRHLQPEQIATVEEARWAIRQLDDIVNSIQWQIERANATRIETGEYADPTWYARVKWALRKTRTTRQAIFMRLGELNRIEERAAKSEWQQSVERRFMNAAMKILTREDVKRIWDEMHLSEAANSGMEPSSSIGGRQPTMGE